MASPECQSCLYFGHMWPYGNVGLIVPSRTRYVSDVAICAGQRLSGGSVAAAWPGPRCGLAPPPAQARRKPSTAAANSSGRAPCTWCPTGMTVSVLPGIRAGASGPTTWLGRPAPGPRLTDMRDILRFREGPGQGPTGGFRRRPGFGRGGAGQECSDIRTRQPAIPSRAADEPGVHNPDMTGS
jgi:hypothetical protein